MDREGLTPTFCVVPIFYLKTELKFFGSFPKFQIQFCWLFFSHFSSFFNTNFLLEAFTYFLFQLVSLVSEFKGTNDVWSLTWMLSLVRTHCVTLYSEAEAHGCYLVKAFWMASSASTNGSIKAFALLILSMLKTSNWIGTDRN